MLIRARAKSITCRQIESKQMYRTVSKSSVLLNQNASQVPRIYIAMKSTNMKGIHTQKTTRNTNKQMYRSHYIVIICIMKP